MGRSSSVDADQVPKPLVNYLHLVFTLDSGVQADVMRPVPELTDPDAWVTVSIPISRLPFSADQLQNASLKMLSIGTDKPAILYIGEIAIVSDTTPISCDAGGDQDVAASDEVTFEGDGLGGVSTLKFEWDFDTKGPFVAQSDGQIVTYKYTKSGDYTVTLRVSDLDGIKEPATAKTTVTVEQ